MVHVRSVELAEGASRASTCVVVLRQWSVARRGVSVWNLSGFTHVLLCYCYCDVGWFGLYSSGLPSVVVAGGSKASPARCFERTHSKRGQARRGQAWPVLLLDRAPIFVQPLRRSGGPVGEGEVGGSKPTAAAPALEWRTLL